MFYELMKRNSRRSRKENSIYFTSLIVAVAAFYVILSLENQEVVRFIRSMESDAVARLLALVPVLYVFSLIVISFLIFFTTRYQMERRNHELGLYLMMGMKRSRLFFLLLGEDLVNTFFSLVVGLPTAILFSEIVSFTTAKLVGIGIVGHQFQISWKACAWTIFGLLCIKSGILGILSGIAVHREPAKLLSADEENREKEKTIFFSGAAFWAAVLMLSAAYFLGASGRMWRGIPPFFVTLFLGMAGTFLLFAGMNGFLEMLMKKKIGRTGLHVFTFRQLQESVFEKSTSLAVCSFLVLGALCCISFGVSAAMAEKPEHMMDYTFPGNGTEFVHETEIGSVLEGKGILEDFDAFYELQICSLDSEVLVYENLVNALEKQSASEERDLLINNLQTFRHPYLIRLSNYNELLEAGGKEPIKLEENQVCLYGNQEFTRVKGAEVLREALKERPELQLDGVSYELIPQMMDIDIVTDRQITLMYALIVPDQTFAHLARGEVDSYWNAVLKKELVEKEGLIAAISQVNGKLNQTNLVYESYVQNIGRHLFYIVAESYTSIYLGVIFLVIANTAISTQFLMYQRKTGKRCQTLLALGSTAEEISKSARKQIQWYFSLPILIGVLSSFFGIWALMQGLLSSFFFEQQNKNMIFTACIVILGLCVIEYLYMVSVMKTSDRLIRRLTMKALSQ